MKPDQSTQTLINQITNFYRQYLSCSPEQLDILALWTLHTHLFPVPPFSPSLNICSRQKQSGKTLCLQLLSLLCDRACMHTAAAPSVLLQQIANGYQYFAGTLLLDDCDATFGKSRMNVRLQGLFTVRFQNDARFITRVQHYDNEYLSEYSYEYSFDDLPVFFPTAFAGNGRLHPCLAERSIQIALEPKQPGSTCQPFRFFDAQNQSLSILESLEEWGKGHKDAFAALAPYKEDQFPPELSFRQRDCAEPLLHVADFIGGEWPQRARQALVNSFALAAFEDLYSSRQILSDLRDTFAVKGNPEWISSADLLNLFNTADDRPWGEWNKGKTMVPKQLAGLLAPFGIRPRNRRASDGTVCKGYYLQDLEPSWRRHLPPIRSTASFDPGANVAANLQDSPAHISGSQLEARRPNPTGAPVAANLQNQQNSVLRYQPQEPGPCPEVSAEGTCPEVLAEGSQQVEAPVAANLQNRQVTLNGDLRLDEGSQKLVAPAVAANSQNQPSVSKGLPR